MKFSSGFLALLAASATQFVAAGPTVSGELSKRSAVGVRSLKCDGDTYKCTADLKYGDGKWVADWPTSVFHRKSSARPSAQELAIMSPVDVETLYCDGDTYLCTGFLKYGDGNWVAQWPTAVMHQSLFGGAAGNGIRIQGAVKVKELTCDGDTYKCTGTLDYGDGNWIAQWGASVYHHKLMDSEHFIFQ